MSVKEAIDLLGYGTAYEIIGAYSGKIYHRSYANSSKNLNKYADRKVVDDPFRTHLAMRGSKNNEWCFAVIGIWMHDYDLVKRKKEAEDAVSN